MSLTISIAPRQNIARVKHRLRPYLVDDTGATYFVPSTVPMQDEPRGDGKGQPIFIEQPIWDYLKKINSADGYRYAKSIGNLWMNRDDGKVETVICGDNYVTWDMETDTHIRVISYPVTFDTTQLNPSVDNWFYKRHLFWRATTIDGYGNISKPGGALDVYFMLVHGKNRLWMNKKDLER